MYVHEHTNCEHTKLKKGVRGAEGSLLQGFFSTAMPRDERLYQGLMWLNNAGYSPPLKDDYREKENSEEELS